MTEPVVASVSEPVRAKRPTLYALVHRITKPKGWAIGYVDWPLENIQIVQSEHTDAAIIRIPGEGDDAPPATAKELANKGSGSPFHCEHANECPGVCPCPPDCYCKGRTCNPTANGWRPASEPPDNDRDVAVHPPRASGSEAYRTGYCWDGTWMVYTTTGASLCSDVTHWHELPEPPK